MTHGHAPRVRHEREGRPAYTISINGEALANNVIEAALTAGVSLAVAQVVKD